MSYQVLARKYRPASFQDLEGQSHVLQALVNALDNQRLHHAYLFTGTRGVGKTTIARILARCLNCESGVTSTPCGECNSCREISEGRSVDLIEVDAASRTGVDDMRDLLDNVQYMPSVSRFKIYLIDEVHMLSRSSFNAMLKTLEEPPEHVKFLFATTDPKKLPVTVLSRCLQFNLKNLSPEQIVHHLGVVLDKESIAYDDTALWQLGHAADGSMRDALSLTDQAISFGDNEVREAPVRTMLGSIDQREVYDLLDAIISEDGPKLLEKIKGLSEFAPDYAALLDDILSVLHRVAVAHAVPDAVDNAQGDRDLVLAAARRVSAEQVQLLYQIGLIGQRDLSLAPMPRIGFEMVLLRMMSFAPGSIAGETASKPTTGSQPSPAANARVSPREGKSSSPIAGLLSAINGEAALEAQQVEPLATESSEKKTVISAEPAQREAAPVAIAGRAETVTDAIAGDEPPGPQLPPPRLTAANWAKILEVLPVTGVTRSLAANCQLDSVKEGRCFLILGEQQASLWNANYEKRIAAALGRLYDCAMEVTITVGSISAETPAQQTEREKEANLARAVADIEADLNVRQLIKNFNGRLDPASIAPLGN